MSEALVPFIDRIRTAVRNERPYIVDGAFDAVKIKLNQNEVPWDVPAALKDELMDRFREAAFNRYPYEQPRQLKKALADYNGVDPEAILVGNGSNELVQTLGLAFLEPGAPLVLPTPMFSLYTMVGRLFDANLIAVPPRSDLRFDIPAICAAVRKNDPVLTVLTTPNNPTGLTLSLEEIEAVMAEAKGFVLVDEAYVEFSDQTSAQRVLDKYPNMLLIRTLSKAFGLAGLRIGYLMGHPALIGEILKARVPFMVDRLSEAAGLTMLAHRELLADRVQQLKTAMAEMTAAMDAMPGVEVVPGQANFLIFKTPLPATEVMQLLAAEGVLVRNMSGYPELPDFLRVNAGSTDENQAFLKALEKAICTPKHT